MRDANATRPILVVGGAGYIGSHTVRHLAEAGERVIVLDNLSLGHRASVISPGVELVVGDLADAALVGSLFATHGFDAVVHCAAYSVVGESVAEPLRYYANNLGASLTLLDVMRRHQCRAFILSSTAAVYGNPITVPMNESHPRQPINPYGWSKFMLEQVLADCEPAWGLRSVALRYFNAAGAAADGLLGEDHHPETHLIPRVLMAVTGEIDTLTVFGRDYPTPDGTGIRDYIHVLDLASAHAAALRHLRSGGPSLQCNLGTGHGCSVQEIITLTESVTGRQVPVTFGPRRAGDPPALVADPSMAKSALGWEAGYPDPRFMIETAWRWLTGPRGGRFE
ncbi:MAG: UDP-glucose 4-epimerase GalE [Verrucomicrobiales bacterium]